LIDAIHAVQARLTRAARKPDNAAVSVRQMTEGGDVTSALGERCLAREGRAQNARPARKYEHRTMR
jgi:hypothetical protein